MLAVLVIVLGVSCLLYSFNNIGFYKEFPHFIRADWGIPLLFGPLIYLYTLFLTDKSRKWDGKDYLHFLPYFINLVVLVPFFLQSGEYKVQILDYFTAFVSGGTDYYYFYSFLLRMAISIITISYALDSVKLLRKYRLKLLSEYSNIEKLRLNWLRILLYSFLVVSLVFIGASIVTFSDRYPQFDYNIYYFLFVFILIYILSYKTLSQPEILSLEFEENTSSPKSKVTRSVISEEVVKVQNYMKAEKPYLNGELTASELAKQLNVSRHLLSEILNDEIGRNFYDFINEFRVEEFKSKVSSPENNHLTLLAIAFESGFNSKTSFNTFFKKSTGYTPSKYKKSLK